MRPPGGVGETLPAMATDEIVRLVLELEPGGPTVAGTIAVGEEAGRRFVGMLDLISAIESIRERPAPSAEPGGEGDAGAAPG